MNALLLLLPFNACPAIAFSEPPALAGQDDAPGPVAIERHDEWPDATSTEAVRTAISKIRKAATKEMTRQGQAELAAIGPAAAPFLLRALGKERDDDAANRIVRALDAVTTPSYTRALARSFEDRKDAVRRYALERSAVLGDPGLSTIAEETWASIEEKLEDERKRKKLDEGTVRAAALLAFSCGHVAAVPTVLERAGSKSYSARSSILSAAAEHARAHGPGVANALTESIVDGKPMDERLGALRLLAFAGSEDHVSAIAKMLDARENPVKIAAINALRRIVDGDPPLEKMSAFDAIERAKTWKARL